MRDILEENVDQVAVTWWPQWQAFDIECLSQMRHISSDVWVSTPKTESSFVVAQFEWTPTGINVQVAKPDGVNSIYSLQQTKPRAVLLAEADGKPRRSNTTGTSSMLPSPHQPTTLRSLVRRMGLSGYWKTRS